MGFMAPLLKMIGPMMLGLTAGSMVGHLAQRSFGQYDLPIPRPPGDELLLIVPNLVEFEREWSLPGDDLRLWVCLHEVAHHAVLNVAHVRARLDDLLRRYLDGFEGDPGRLESELGNVEALDLSGPEAFQELLGNPEVVLGAIQSPAQKDLLPQLEALVCVIVGYVDHVMDQLGNGLLSGYPMITEAVRRRRVEAASADRFVERLFGLELTQAAYDRGSAFIEGVVERAGDAGLARLWHSDREVPTPAEVDAPGLWLARIDLPDID
jgi:putative hydrolase